MNFEYPFEMLYYPSCPESSLLGVSGGGDSVALALWYRIRGVEAVIGHVRHGDSLWQHQSELFVVNLATRLGMVASVKAIAEVSRGGAGYEAKCRKLRYLALSEIAIASNMKQLVTAHTRDDFAETVAIALHRKQGLKALSGIPERRVHRIDSQHELEVYRPFLQLTRATLRDWLRTNHETWLEDPTNDDRNHGLRNSIRADWMKLSPVEYEATIVQMEQIAASARSQLDEAATELDRIWSDLVEIHDSLLVADSRILVEFRDETLQVFIDRVALYYQIEPGGIPGGNRTQFTRTISDRRWGSVGKLGIDITYRLTKLHCTFQSSIRITGNTPIDFATYH